MLENKGGTPATFSEHFKTLLEDYKFLEIKKSKRLGDTLVPSKFIRARLETFREMLDANGEPMLARCWQTFATKRNAQLEIDAPTSYQAKREVLCRQLLTIRDTFVFLRERGAEFANRMGAKLGWERPALGIAAQIIFGDDGDNGSGDNPSPPERPYRCDFENCTIAFPTVGRLNAHKRTHTTPYKCNEYEGCMKEYAQANFLRDHIQVVHKGQKFNCNICPKEYDTRSSLASHFQAKHTDKMYKCELCGKIFNRFITYTDGNIQLQHLFAIFAKKDLNLKVV